MIIKGFGQDTIITRGLGSRFLHVIRREVVRLKSIITKVLNIDSRA